MVLRLFIILTTGIFLQSNHSAAQPSGYWNQPMLNTAAHANYLNQFEKQVILELNKVRLNPAKYAEDYLAKLLNAYDGKLLTFDDAIPIRTQEGKRALLECIRELKKTQALPILSPSPGLSQAAKLLVVDQQKSGKVGHIGEKGSNPQSRVEQFGNWTDGLAENITYGSNSPQQVVINLLIDDGVPNRGHRKNILNKTFKTIGVAAGSHPKYKKMCVMEMAGSFQYK